MSDIIKKMSDQVPEAFSGFDILLAANVTIATHHSSPAVQAVSLRSFRDVAHNKFLLK